jgi:hypothetical protein
MKGMTRVIFCKETAKVRDEPKTIGYCTTSSKPKFTVQREKPVPRLEAMEER